MSELEYGPTTHAASPVMHFESYDSNWLNRPRPAAGEDCEDCRRGRCAHACDISFNCDSKAHHQHCPVRIASDRAAQREYERLTGDFR